MNPSYRDSFIYLLLIPLSVLGLFYVFGPKKKCEPAPEIRYETPPRGFYQNGKEGEVKFYEPKEIEPGSLRIISKGTEIITIPPATTLTPTFSKPLPGTTEIKNGEINCKSVKLTEKGMECVR